MAPSRRARRRAAPEDDQHDQPDHGDQQDQQDDPEPPQKFQGRTVWLLYLGTVLAIAAYGYLLHVNQWEWPWLSHLEQAHGAVLSNDVARLDRVLDARGGHPATFLQEENGHGMTAMTLAAFKGHVEVSEHLLALGVPVDAPSRVGWTALMGAASRGHTPLVRLLLEWGADVEAASSEQFLTPLMLAANGGHLDAVRLLLAAGADPQRRSAAGETAQARARREGHRAVFNVLVEASGGG